MDLNGPREAQDRKERTLCHAWGPLDRRVRAIDLVHPMPAKRASRELLAGMLDSVSLKCLSCYDGSTAQDVNHPLPGESAFFSDMKGLSHPMGVDYREAAARNRKLRPPEVLSPAMAVYGGKVGCASCHMLYSKEQQCLSMPNVRSAFCLECHDI